jgi:Family of unknown function (DUF6152)
MPASASRAAPASVRLAWIGLLVASSVMLGGSHARTHHSLAGIYDSSARVSIEGTVVSFHFVNPHPYLIVGVTDGRGAKQEWRLEMDNRFELEGIGMTSRTLVPGDRITASGSRGRTQLTSLYVRRLDRPSDGYWYEQVGSTPRMRS